MQDFSSKDFTKCQDDLEKQGYFLTEMTLPKELKTEVEKKDFEQVDKIIRILTKPEGAIFQTLLKYREFSEIEFILSLRESQNSWEEDGIWHDDGSRILAFSLSLTITSPEGGILELREKGSNQSLKIPTPDYGQMIVFKTGVEAYEHKINRVSSGSRLIAAGWCT